ncbi:hypothetical protein PUNSTDRAFT_62455, partial [Punctularia strigosozonata HHB-11173 SS5]|uniref:uncharacterized protein n=1 Tax=Punctularia strigosozonata (strain HHB-11173) TaxID=741275 RepID=UPI00044184E3
IEGEWCSDYVVSSYTPTLGALITARSAHISPKKQDIQALVAAVPSPYRPEWRDLVCTREELGTIRSVIPERALMAIPPADDALASEKGGMSAQTLLEKLPQATILHLACHGHQNREDALKSGFVMRDEMVTIEKLMPISLPHAFMAFLSACETAKGDKNQPDQTVHLAATLLFAGFKSVIATLWSMEDADGPFIARSVYEDLFGGSSEYLNADDIPYALDRAVQKLRESHPNPSRWAPYIHIGI